MASKRSALKRCNICQLVPADAGLSTGCLPTAAALARLSTTILLSLGETASACRDVLLLDKPLGLQYAAAISMSWDKFCKACLQLEMQYFDTAV